MTELEGSDEFAARYFDDWRILRSGSRPERLRLEHDHDSPGDRLFEMLMDADGAEEAWPLILTLVERAPDEALGFVGAGPLEDLVVRHAAQFGDRLIDQPRRDPRFRDALTSVWGWEAVPEPWRTRLLELILPGDSARTRRRRRGRTRSV